jgi:hypothetical protein
MRLSKLAIAIAAAGWLCAGPSFAQTRSQWHVRRATPARTADYDYSEFQPPAPPPAEESPSDAPRPNGQNYYQPPAGYGSGNSCCKAAEPTCEAAEATCEAGEPTCEAQSECKNGCGCDCCNWCDLGEPCELFDDCCCLKSKSIVLKGFIDQGITFNSRGPDDRFNGPLTFNDRAGEYQFNQLYLYAERTANTECQPCDWGFRVDALYGTDWRFTPAVGLEIEADGTRDWNQSHRFYGLALPQFYAAAKLNDLEVRFGKFYTTAGYEVVPSTGNFFYSHLYTHQYGEPFTHTGVMFMYTVSDNLTVHACIHEGWDQFEDINDDPALLAGFTWTSSDKKTTFAYSMTWGDEANHLFFTNTQNRYYQGIVFTRQVGEKLKYVAHSDYGVQEEVSGAGTPDAEWYSISQYLIYTVNDCLSYGFRYEWFRDDDGFRVFGVGSAEFAAGVPSPMGFIGGGYAGSFQDISLGINYKPNANLLLRPEVRYDWYNGLASGVNGRPLPFGDGNEDSQFMFAVDAIITF